MTADINFIEDNQLKEIDITKGEAIILTKTFCKKIIDYLKEKNPARIDDFKYGALELVKFIVDNFRIVKTYTGPALDPET